MVSYKQDMPPPGGYAALEYKRIPPRVYFSSKGIMAYVVSLVGLGWISARAVKQILKNRTIEFFDRELAIEPFLLAERDRAFLKQLRLNYEMEAEIMKDVPDWEVGTFYGKPVYRTTPDDYHIDPTPDEYFSHMSERDAQKHWNYSIWKFYGFLK